MGIACRIGGFFALLLECAVNSTAIATPNPFIYTSSGNNIGIYATDGSFTNFTYATQPDGLAFDASGNLVVGVNAEDAYVGAITPGGVWIPIAGPILSAEAALGIAIDASGNIYTSGGGSNNIIKITPGGTTSVFANLPDVASGVGFNGAGNLYAVLDNSIDQITPGGSVTTFITGLTAGRDIAFNASGDAFVTNDLYPNGNVQEYSPTGTFMTTVASNLATPYSLAFDNSDDLYIGNIGYPNAENGTIEEIAANGSISTFASEMPGAWAMAIAPQYALVLPFPEPASASLLLIFGASVLLRRPRKRLA